MSPDFAWIKTGFHSCISFEGMSLNLHIGGATRSGLMYRSDYAVMTRDFMSQNLQSRRCHHFTDLSGRRPCSVESDKPVCVGGAIPSQTDPDNQADMDNDRSAFAGVFAQTAHGAPVSQSQVASSRSLIEPCSSSSSTEDG